jgi:DNA adenine methylase
MNVPGVRYGNDLNGELIETFVQVQSNVECVIKQLNKHVNSKEHFLKIRKLDRDPIKFAKLAPAVKAARFIYLNKTCFNGLYRVNQRGEFNVPFGDMKNANIVPEELLREVSENLRGQIENGMKSSKPAVFTNLGFRDATKKAKEGDGVYFDPPYDPLSPTSSFVSYASNGFDREDQEKLRDLVIELTEKGVRVVVSNSSTPFIRKLYKHSLLDIEVLPVKRSISAIHNSRGQVQEVIISNYRHLVKKK